MSDRKDMTVDDGSDEPLGATNGHRRGSDADGEEEDGGGGRRSRRNGGGAAGERKKNVNPIDDCFLGRSGQFWAFALIVLTFGLAIGMIIGTTFRPTPPPVGLSGDELPSISVHISIINTTLQWCGQSYPRKLMNVTGGEGLQMISGLQAYVLPDITTADQTTANAFSAFYANKLGGGEETVIHAHGMTPPNNMDGVPFVTSPPIPAGREQWYHWPLSPLKRNGGTYFLHSHYGLQTGEGLVLPLIIHDPPPQGYPMEFTDLIRTATDEVMLLQDWCPYFNDIDDDGVNHGDNRQTCSLGPVIAAVKDEMNRTMSNESPAQQESEVENACQPIVEHLHARYHAHTVNGRFTEQPATIAIDESRNAPIRLRVINAADSSNYLLDFRAWILDISPDSLSTPTKASAAVRKDSEPIRRATIIAVDGHYVQPFDITADGFDGGGSQPYQYWIGVAQRVDILLHSYANTLPEDGTAMAIVARDESPDFSMSGLLLLHSWSITPTAAMASVNLTAFLQPYTPGVGWWVSPQQDLSLRAAEPLSDLFTRSVDRVIHVNATGHHGGINHYSFFEYPATEASPTISLLGSDGTSTSYRAVPPSNPAPLYVRYGERVEIVFNNFTPEPHAMHLHGHSMQIVNVDGIPLTADDGGGAWRDTVMLGGGCHNMTLRFDALNPGIHELHCHMTIHMMSGMITTLEYLPSDSAAADPMPSMPPNDNMDGHMHM